MELVQGKALCLAFSRRHKWRSVEFEIGGRVANIPQLGGWSLCLRGYSPSRSPSLVHSYKKKHVSTNLISWSHSNSRHQCSWWLTLSGINVIDVVWKGSMSANYFRAVSFFRPHCTHVFCNDPRPLDKKVGKIIVSISSLNTMKDQPLFFMQRRKKTTCKHHTCTLCFDYVHIYWQIFVWQGDGQCLCQLFPFPGSLLVFFSFRFFGFGPWTSWRIRSSCWSGTSSVWRCTQRPHEQENRPESERHFRTCTFRVRVSPTPPVTRPVRRKSLSTEKTSQTQSAGWQVAMGCLGWWDEKKWFAPVILRGRRWNEEICAMQAQLAGKALTQTRLTILLNRRLRCSFFPICMQVHVLVYHTMLHKCMNSSLPKTLQVGRDCTCTRGRFVSWPCATDWIFFENTCSFTLPQWWKSWGRRADAHVVSS